MNTPDEFKTRAGLGFIHFNTRSLLPKLDFKQTWAQSTDTDILIISETWFSKSVLAIKGCAPRRKGGGIAIYPKNQFLCNNIYSVSVQEIEPGSVCEEVSENDENLT